MVWVYLVSRDGSDVEAQEWAVEDILSWKSLTPIPNDDYIFTRFEDAKRDAIRRQKGELAYYLDWIQGNLKHLHSLSAKDVKPKRSDT